MIKMYHNVFLILLEAEGYLECDTASEEEYESYCYTYTHIYNNMITEGKAYYNGAEFLYGDHSLGRNTFENNVMFGCEKGCMALYLHCGKKNMGLNNIVHRNRKLANMYGGCGQQTLDRPQEYENYHNIYLLDDMDDFTFGRSSDRYFDLPPNFHHNIYWSTIPDAKEKRKFPDNLNWYEWQASGNDTGSLWENPLFEDADAHIYILAEDSPAWELGIQQIDLDNIGIQDYGKYEKDKNNLQ